MAVPRSDGDHEKSTAESVRKGPNRGIDRLFGAREVADRVLAGGREDEVGALDAWQVGEIDRAQVATGPDAGGCS